MLLMKFKSYQLLVILFFILTLLLVGCGSGPKDENSQDTIFFGYTFSESSLKFDTLFLDYDQDGEKIELRVMWDVEKEFAEEIISNKVLLFKTLFEPHKTGYTGQYTRYIECPQEFKPTLHSEELDGGSLEYFKSFANSNHVAGVCAKDLIQYLSVHGYLYCDRGKSMIEFSYFTDLDKESNREGFIEKISCDLG